MKLLVDSTVLFAGIIKESTTRWLLFHLDAELLTIEFSYQEVEKYKEDILQKSKLTEKQFLLIFSKIKERLTVLTDSVVHTQFKEAYQIMKDIDPRDSPFVAAALATKASIWSDDRHFKKQNRVKVWTTKELVKYL